MPKASVVLEIGPGPGVLTEALLETGHRVVAVETDRVFAQALSRLSPTKEQLTVIEGDIRDGSWTDLVPKGAALVSNLPYHITTPILERLIEVHDHFSSAVLMVQTEVAHRLVDTSSSLLGVLLGCCYEVQYGFFVSRSCFWPKPKSDSAVLYLHERMMPLKDEKTLFTLIRRAFAHRRKTVLHSLGSFYPKQALEDAFQGADIALNARPEDLSVQQWQMLGIQLFG